MLDPNKYRKKYGDKDYNLVDTDMIFGLGKHAPVVDPNAPATYQSSSDSNGILGSIGAIALVVFGGFWLADVIENNANYSQPYKYIAMFYDYTVIVPIKSFPKVWYWLADTGNVLLTLGGIVAYGILVIVLYSAWVHLLAYIFKGDSDRPDYGTAWSLFFFPALIGAIWWVGSWVVKLIMSIF